MERILVTGAAKRLGAVMVRALARPDRVIVIQTFSSRPQADELAAELSGQGTPVVVVAADLASDTAVRGLIDAAASAAGGPITGLVNNASVLDYDAPGAFDVPVFDEAMRINLKVPLMLADAFAARLPEGAQGRIVNILDQKLWNLNPDFYAYTCSKAGLQAATQMLAMALAPRIMVNAVAPGPVLVSYDQNDAEFDAMAALNPLARPI
nr:SDR family NAD(P)-dependent oxidoreductase [Hyphomonadaceae bacterium]